MPADPPDIPCAEGDPAYDVRWPWRDGPLRPGLTCVFRVKDEAAHVARVLPRVLGAVTHVVWVDNGSTDGTTDVALEVVAALGAQDRFTALSYPARVSRAGREHLATPPDSRHSLTHFYNWCFAHVRTRWSMKWDGDMVLTREGADLLRDLAWQLDGRRSGRGAVVQLPRHPLWVVSEREGWLDLSSRFREPWISPTGPGYTFSKAPHWEMRSVPPGDEVMIAPTGLCVELKEVSESEFRHWSGVEDFDPTTARRKAREWQVFRAIRDGRAAGPDGPGGLVHVVAPAGVHVVDHVVETWIPARPRPLVGGPDRVTPADA